MLRLLFTALLLLILLARGAARFDLLGSERALAQGGAPPSTRLTSRGRLMPGGSISAFWSNDQPTFFGNYGTYATWNLSVAPSLVYFVRDDLGIGIAGGVGYQRGTFRLDERYVAREFSLGATFVWNVRLGGRFSLMLNPFIGYAQSKQRARIVLISFASDPTPAGGASDELLVHVTAQLKYVRFALSLPVVYAITDSVGVGIGPTLLYDVCFRESRASGLPSGVGSYRLPDRNRIRVGAAAAFYASF